MDRFYAIIHLILNLVIGYLSVVYLRIGYLMMTNTAKMGENPEGEGLDSGHWIFYAGNMDCYNFCCKLSL